MKKKYPYPKELNQIGFTISKLRKIAKKDGFNPSDKELTHTAWDAYGKAMLELISEDLKKEAKKKRKSK